MSNWQSRGERLDDLLWSLRWNSWLTPLLNFIRPPKPIKPMDPLIASGFKREVERILHHKALFVETMNRQYDSQYKSDAKITVNARIPPRYR